MFKSQRTLNLPALKLHLRIEVEDSSTHVYNCYDFLIELEFSEFYSTI